MIYLDNGATSFPKPPEVVEAVSSALLMAGNPGRSSHDSARLAAKSMELARLRIAKFLGIGKPQQVIFQPGATQASNLLINGSFKSGDRICISSMEHNAVTRPLSRLARRGVKIEKIPCDPTGVVRLDAAEALLCKEPTAGLICQHGSNVAGCFQPIRELVQLAHQYNARIIVDGAQAAGHIALNLDEIGVDAWFCSGHKGVPGPQGIGLFYLKDDFHPAALVVGGTGSGSSAWDENCTSDPECYEVGTPAFPLIMGLAAAADWLERQGKAVSDSGARENSSELGIHELESTLTDRLHRGLLDIPGITVLGPGPSVPRLPLVSFVAEQLAPDTIAHHLDADYGIAVRAGLHCAPDAHETLGSINTGAVRLSLNYANTLEEIETVLIAVAKIVRAYERP